MRHQMAWFLAKRYLGPNYRVGPEPLVHEVPTKERLISLLNLVCNSGEDTRYSHPNMPGRDFSKADVEVAASLVIVAEENILKSEEPARGQSNARQVKRLMDNKSFSEAVSGGNPLAELAIALNEIDIGNRMLQLSESHSTQGATFREQAEQDVVLCAAIASQSSRPDANEATFEVSIGLRIINHIFRRQGTPSTSAFQMAMERLDDIRWACREFGEDDIEAAFNGYAATERILTRYRQMEREGPLRPVDSYILQRMDLLTESMSALEAASQVIEEVDLLERHIEEMPDYIEQTERPVRAVAEMFTALDLASEYVRETASEDPRLSRMREIASRDRLPTPIQLALRAIAEYRAENSSVELPSSLYPSLPPANDSLDDLLPQGSDERSNDIRELARTLEFYVTDPVPFPLVPTVCRRAIAQLRANYSPEAVVQRATEIVDMSRELVPVDPGIRAPLPETLSDDDYEAVLASLPEEKQRMMVRAQFREYAPSLECMENAARLMGISDSWMGSSLLGEWRPNRGHTQRIVGTYGRSNIIDSFDDADIRLEDIKDSTRFEFSFDRASGRITLVEGWENPHLRELDGMQIADPLPILVFPLPHSVRTDKELDELLDTEFPQNVQGQESRRNMQVRAVARTLVLYAYLHSDDGESWRSSLSQQAGRPIDVTIPRVYREAVAQVQEDNSIDTVIPLAIRLVNQYGDEEPPVRSTPAPPLSMPAREDSEQVLLRLGSDEMELIGIVLGTDQCTGETISQFLGLHPGIRELRMRNALSTRWTEGEFDIDISRLRNARDSIYRECHLSEPTEEEKRYAAEQIGELSIAQSAVIASFFAINTSELTAAHVQMFGVWLRGDERELRAAWQDMYPDIAAVTMLQQAISMGRQTFTPEEISLICRIRGKNQTELTEDDYKVHHFERYMAMYREQENHWMHTTRDNRMAIWKRGVISALTAAELCHRVTYLKNTNINENERRMLSIAFAIEPSQVTEELVSDMVDAMISKHANQNPPHIYHAPLLRTVQHANVLGLENLFATARRNSEFNTLAEFLGCAVSEPRAILDPLLGMTRPKDYQGIPATNEDSFSSAIVSTEKEDIRLHAVFDGMGGHHSGEVASNIAKQVFEISAVAGWINSPEDLRKVILLADMVVVAEAISQKKSDDDYQEIDMGTTATITMQKGREFYGAHCGDSPYRVLRKGQTIISSQGHNFELLVTMNGGPVDAALQETIKKSRNVIISALGSGIHYISINNALDGNFSPVLLENDDVIMLSSDGVTDVVLDEETHFLLAFHQGNLQQVMREHIDLAARRDEMREYDTIIPGSKLVADGKLSDDKTLIMDRVTGADE